MQSKTTISVFLDSCVLKASVDTRLVSVPKQQTIAWGEREFDVEIHRPAYVNQNVKYLKHGNLERFEDTVALRFIAALAIEGKICLLMSNEVFFELMRLPRVIGGPRFYDAPIQIVEDPIQYSRIILDGTNRDHQYEFLCGVKHDRFTELQKACGAYQGSDKPLNRNQLIDAFHVLCAESAAATYFLTHDDRLIRVLTNGPRPKTSVTLITPKRLLLMLVCQHPLWLWSIWRERIRILKSRRKLTTERQYVSRDP